MSNSKENLNVLNYGQKAAPYCEEKWVEIVNDGSTYTPFLSEYNISSLVWTDIKELEKLIEKDSKLNNGVISNGVHTEDYEKFFKFKTDGTRNTSGVMYVFENPAANLGASFINGYSNRLEKNFYECVKNRIKNSTTDEEKGKAYSYLLSNRLWHADPNDIPIEKCYKDDISSYVSDYNKPFFAFERKGYSQLMLSIILTFKLKKFYTTNQFIYEVFEYKKTKRDLNMNHT